MNPSSDAGTNLAGKQSASPVSWPFVAMICLPLMLIRFWMLSLPFQYYDFHTYWFAGRLFVSGGHPYSPAAMLAAERLHNPAITNPQVLLCPPWTLPFLGLLGILPIRAAQIGWFAASLLLNCLSSIGLWIYFGGAKRQAWIALLIACTFIPMGGAEFMGQITPMMLACLTAFLLLNKSGLNFAAGLSLLGFGLKPHLLYLVLLAVFFWAVQKRAWSMLSGAICSYAGATLFALLYNPSALEYMHHTVGTAVATPCGVGWVLRSYFGLEHAWLQFLPTIFGVAWFLAYWVKHRRDWDWQDQIPALVVLSLCTTPYCWYHDFICILPALVSLAVRGAYRSRVALAAYLGVQTLVVLSAQLSPAWMGLASLMWIPLYFVTGRFASRWTNAQRPARALEEALRSA